MSAPLALAIGFVIALCLKQKQDFKIHKLSNTFLKISIVLMGFGMSWTQAIQSSSSGLKLTTISVFLTIVSGILIGKIMKVDAKTTLLISAGTAICGGSAIAAVSPIINAKNSQLSFALIVIFVLNAIALLVFPLIGEYLSLSQEVFGNWAAIAIHDTTSVVGAGEAYGNQALEIATTVKLTRALWIIPMALLLGILNKSKNTSKLKLPWFILLFVMAMLAAHQFPQFELFYTKLDWLGRRGMLMALLFIGASLQLLEIKKAGFRPFLLGISLWILISTVSLFALNQII